MSKIPGTPEYSAELLRYIRDLRSFDWQFEYSDDYSVVKRGQEALGQLRTRQRSIDPLGNIWKLLMPANCRHTPDVVKEVKAHG